MGRSPCCVKEGLNRGAWTSQEDKILKDYIKVHGEGKWRSLPKRAGLKRCGKSCRLRWLNYLRPDIKRGNITDDEEDLIIRLHKLLGNRWSLIAGRLPGRTDNEIKNYWNTNISKRVHNNQVQNRDNYFNLNRGRGHHYSNFEEHESAKKNSSSSNSNINNNNNNNNNGALSHIRECSYVVRTKASRCTKVFINAKVDQIINNMEIMKAPSIIDAMSTQPLVPTFFTREDNNISSADHHPLELMEEDDKFLSDFLSSAAAPFDDFDDLGFADINLLLPEEDKVPSSQHAETTSSSSVHDQQQNYSDALGSMASLLDSGLDWLHDN